MYRTIVHVCFCCGTWCSDLILYTECILFAAFVSHTMAMIAKTKCNSQGKSSTVMGNELWDVVLHCGNCNALWEMY